MDPAQQGLTFEENIKQVMRTLPPPIRNYLGQGKYSVVAENLMNKYGLHIDQGGILEREIMLLVMGVENPTEFTQSLITEANLDGQTVDGISQDINDQIFIPLREEMRRGGSVQQQTPRAVPQAPARVNPPPVNNFSRVSQPVAPAMPRPNVPPPPSYGAPAAPAPQRYVPPPAPRPAAPAPAVQAERVSLPVNFTPPPPAPSSHIAPLPPKLVMPPAQGFPNRTAAPLPPKFSDYSTGRPAARPAMEEIPAMLPLGEEEPEPSTSDHPINLLSRPSAPAPLQSFPPREPRFAPPPANLPGAIFHGELRAPADATPHFPPPAAPKTPSAVSPKPYVSDPYHEPIDEEGSR